METRRWQVLLLLAAAASAAPAVAAAAPGLSVGPVRGDPRAALSAQLAEALCVRFECVLWPRVSTRGRPDFAKARAAGVQAILLGSVERASSGARSARIRLLREPPQPARSWLLPLDRAGRLRPDELRRLETELAEALPAPPPPRRVAPHPVPLPPPPVPRVRPPPPAAAAAPAPRPPPAPPARTPAGPAAGPWRAAFELGAFLSRRELTYGGLAPMSGTLRGFDVGAFGGGLVRAELFPAARREGVLAGAGLLAEYARSVGLRTEAPTGEKRSTTFSRLELGATWRSPPLGGWRLVLAPSLSWRWSWFEVSPAIDGLPDAALSGPRVGLAAELPVRWGITLLAGGGWTRWLSARDLVKGSPAFFPGGSASAVDLEAGVGVAVGGPVSLRLLGDYARTGYTLEADPTGRYAASSASDRSIGLRAVARLQL